MRILGLDVGARTIGVAVSDELGVAGHALETIQRQGTEADVDSVIALASRFDAREIVVGQPLELSGRQGRRASRVDVFVEALRNKAPALAIHYWDERFSTREAQGQRKQKRQDIDALAAAIILQGFLDRRKEDESAQ